MELRLKKRIVGSMLLVATALIIVPLFFNHSIPSDELRLSSSIPISPAKPSNLALPIPPRSATNPAVAHQGNQPEGQAPVVFEQLQSLGAENNNPAPKPAAAIATPPVAAAQTVASSAPKASVPLTPVVNSPAVDNANQPIATNNIEKLEQQAASGQAPAVTQATSAAVHTTATAAEPLAAQQPAATAQSAAHKKSAKNANAHVAKAEPAIKSKNTASNPQSWAVQLGSFSDKLNAEKLMKKLQAEGFTAYTRTSKTTHGELIRVLVGPELHHNDADSLLAKLEKQLNLHGMVVKGE